MIENHPTAAIILGAGRGTRLNSVTRPFSKTTLLVNGLPVIGYPARAVEPYVDRLILVANSKTADSVYEAVMSSLQSNLLEVKLVMQDKPRGMADAIRVGLSALDEDHTVVVVAGDNIILDDQNVKTVLDCVRATGNNTNPRKLAWTFRELPPNKARRFSVYHELKSGFGKLVEKPADPPSDICWCGPIAFRSSMEALHRFKDLSLSLRGEYEATDLMNTFIMNGESCHLKLTGEWFDVGTVESLQDARESIKALLLDD